ncbi:hypothetical protein ACFQX6_21155 [Streptosporangium lutulentum]
MANGGPNSNGSQFWISLSEETTQLEPVYTPSGPSPRAWTSSTRSSRAGGSPIPRTSPVTAAPPPPRSR